MSAAARLAALTPADRRAALRAYDRAVARMADAFDALGDIERIIGHDYDGMIDELVFTTSGAPGRGEPRARFQVADLAAFLDACTDGER